MLIIEGRRILLRDHLEADLPAMHAWCSDPRATRYLARRSRTLEDSAQRLAECLRENESPDRRHYFFAVLLKPGGPIIGEAGFTLEEGSADLGYFLMPAYWGQGYASEAAALMLDYCFAILKLARVTAGCDSRNQASQAVMRKSGLQLAAVHPHHQLLDGSWRDRLEYAITFEEWNMTHLNMI